MGCYCGYYVHEITKMLSNVRIFLLITELKMLTKFRTQSLNQIIITVAETIVGQNTSRLIWKMMQKIFAAIVEQTLNSRNTMATFGYPYNN